MHEDNRASHALYISARGGTGVYRYYWNGEEFDGPVKTVVATLCTYVVGTARIEDTGGNVKDIAVGFTAFCPTPFGCNDCELWRP